MNLVNNQSTRIGKKDRRIADSLDYSDVDFPVSARNYCKIEDKNGICINVFSYEGKVVCPIYGFVKNFDDCINLLMIHEGNRSHYVHIKDFSRLMFSKTESKNKKWFCMHCLQCFSSENVLNKHKENCLVINGEQRVKLNEGFISFKNYSRPMEAPFKIYADFEFILKKSKALYEVFDENSLWSKKYQDHVPCGFGYKVVCVDDRFTKNAVVHRGEDCVNKFIDAILREHEFCKDLKNYFNKNLIMSMEEEEVFQLSNKCWICGRLFDLMDEKVRDHCHESGKFRGAAHFSCNANFKISKKVPVVFLNLKWYDGHLIVKELSNFDVVIDVIPNGLEKYMAFIVNRNLVFIDSMQFINCSLDSLVRNLVDEDFKYLSREFSGECLELVKEKCVYPYEYVDSFKKFDKGELPGKDAFFSSLKGKSISEEDYLRAANVWNVFGIKKLGEYHDLYLKTDALLLCDVFENFIDVCLEYYGLDPCHYFSSPGLSWNAMLKMAGLELELISDIDVHLIIEKGMRGGIFYIAKKVL